MNFDEIFSAYYRQYRAEATVPISTDDEYTIAMSLANEAVSRWENYDSTYWRELFTTNQLDNATGTQTITTGTTTYLAPDNFREAGGLVKIKDSNGDIVQRYPIVNVNEVQFQGEDSTYAYFRRGANYYSTGTASQSGTTITGSGTTFTSAMTGMEIQFLTGETATITYVSATSLTASVSQTVSSTTYKIISNRWNLVLNPAPTSAINGYDIEYDYYKSATPFTTGVSETEMSNPYYIVHRILANRFRASRNPYYSSANKDAEDALKMMQGDNNSGNWANPPVLADNSGVSWGV